MNDTVPGETFHLTRPRFRGPAERTLVEPRLGAVSGLALNGYAEPAAVIEPVVGPVVEPAPEPVALPVGAPSAPPAPPARHRPAHRRRRVAAAA
ncbi:hypothetical protein [Actinomadura atramentaria]|uniref:hypothetical protein n=1 Tax=Actinomadura atramentaria TaxID=1990 RepID=UPI00037AE9DF|nr:hypothetical protein [Actinomadura atramentaria]